MHPLLPLHMFTLLPPLPKTTKSTLHLAHSYPCLHTYPPRNLLQSFLTTLYTLHTVQLFVKFRNIRSIRNQNYSAYWSFYLPLALLSTERYTFRLTPKQTMKIYWTNDNGKYNKLDSAFFLVHTETQISCKKIVTQTCP